jgi:hypothetical protein
LSGSFILRYNAQLNEFISDDGSICAAGNQLIVACLSNNWSIGFSDNCLFNQTSINVSCDPFSIIATGIVDNSSCTSCPTCCGDSIQIELTV